MSQLPLFQSLEWTLTVSELTRYIRELLEGDEALRGIWVQGEVSNLSRPRSGHLYFTLKDAGATLRCVMWRAVVQRQTTLPGEGDAVEVHGDIGVYEAGGQYQLYADLIRPLGEGRLYQEFLRLKARLEAEGLFEQARKRPIPEWPRRIGVVTSPTGAALQDILNTLRRRYPLVEVILAPTLVQGDDAPEGIVAALERLNTKVHPDVILLARGGGSIEDLWAFNDERVARAVAASQAPVITGVGHETDFTIADFAADLRAPTPTAAAELATPTRDDLKLALADLRQRAGRAMRAHLQRQQTAFDLLRAGLGRHSPLARVRSDRQRLDDLSQRAHLAIGQRLRLAHTHLAGIHQRLEALNPAAVLARGYAIVTRADGQVVRRVAQARPGDPLDVQVSDGSFGARVQE